MKLVGANSTTKPAGDGQLPGMSNYLIGNDPSKWHRDVPQFARVRYRDVYPGIDLVVLRRTRDAWNTTSKSRRAVIRAG